MKVAMAGRPSGSAGGGSEGYEIESLAGALASHGHEVTLFTASPPDDRESPADVSVVPLPCEPPETTATDGHHPVIGDMGRFLVDRWHDDRPDVVHCYGWNYGMAAQLAANRTSLPTVQGFHRLATLRRRHHGATASSDTAVKLETVLARNATLVTAGCGDSMREVIRLGCPRTRVSVLPSGIDVDGIEAHEPGAGAGKVPHRIVAVARDFSGSEGLPQVVRTLPSMPRAEAVLIATGAADDSDAHRVLAMADKLRVGRRVRLVATADDDQIAAFLRTADVVVCPSAYDGDTQTVLQAMACGTAVVATAAGGPRDAVIEEVTGLLISTASVDALSRALRSILGQNVLRQGMGLAGRARARSRYSWERIATDAEVIYHNAARRCAAMTG